MLASAANTDPRSRGFAEPERAPIPLSHCSRRIGGATAGTGAHAELRCVDRLSRFKDLLGSVQISGVHQDAIRGSSVNHLRPEFICHPRLNPCQLERRETHHRLAFGLEHPECHDVLHRSPSPQKLQREANFVGVKAGMGSGVNASPPRLSSAFTSFFSPVA